MGYILKNTSGGGGGGDATAANQVLQLAQDATAANQVNQVLQLEANSAIPSVLKDSIGDSVFTENSNNDSVFKTNSVGASVFHDRRNDSLFKGSLENTTAAPFSVISFTGVTAAGVAALLGTWFASNPCVISSICFAQGAGTHDIILVYKG